MGRRGSRPNMDWLRLDLRLAVYIRDGFDCVWCRGVFPLPLLGHGLCLDHVVPGNGNTASNLVTACLDCNSLKRNLTLIGWAGELEKLGIDPDQALARVRAQLQLPVDRVEGLRLAKLRRPKYSAGDYCKVPGTKRKRARTAA